MRSFLATLVVTGAVASIAGCAAPTAGAEDMEATSQADSATHAYVISIDNVHVSKTRSKNTDTDVASIGLKINGSMVNDVHVTRDMGSQANGLGLSLVTPPINPNDQVEILFSVVNDHTGGSAQTVVNTLNAVSDAAEKVADKLYPLGPVWPAVNSGIKWLNGLFGGWCDGTVVADAVLASGSQLGDLTAGGPRTTTQRYDGTDSNAGCGANSLYFMQYTIRRQW